ncbi:GNAT family N-acetyltransferase [Guggenheimella bovis]
MERLNYPDHVLWQYTVHRLKKHVLYIGKKHEPLMEQLKLEGCVVEEVLFQEGDHSFSSWQTLVDRLKGDFQGSLFDTVIIRNPSELIGDYLDLIDVLKELTDKAGNVIVLDQKSQELEKRYAHVKEDFEDSTIYVVNHIITKKNQKDLRIRIYMNRALQGKNKYSLSLFGERIVKGDVPKLADTMYTSYRNTIDYDGETLLEMRDEVESILEGKDFPFLSDASFVVKEDGRIVSAVLTSLLNDKPLIAYLFTLPEYRNRHLATRLLEAVIEVLEERGFKEVTLACTVGNPAYHLYRRFGFRELGRSII